MTKRASRIGFTASESHFVLLLDVIGFGNNHPVLRTLYEPGIAAPYGIVSNPRTGMLLSPNHRIVLRTSVVTVKRPFELKVYALLCTVGNCHSLMPDTWQ